MNQRQIRTLMGFALTIILLLPLAAGHTPALIERFELDLYDMRLQQSLTHESDPRIVIVDIDEKSLAAIGRWPWRRDIVATMLDQLFDQYGVAVVGFDMLFSEADTRLPLAQVEQMLSSSASIISAENDLAKQLATITPDAYFAKSVSGRSVILGNIFDPNQENLSVGLLGTPVVQNPERLADLPIPEAVGFIGNLATFQSNTPWSGFFDNPKVDSDGVYRRVPLIQRYQNNYYPSLSLAVFLALYGENFITPVIESDSTGAEKALVAIDAAGLRFPVAPDSSALVPYRGYQGSFTYVSAVDIIQGTASPEDLEGTLVLIGTSAAGLLDLRVTPLSNRYAGVEIHANLLSGMLDERFHQEPDYTKAIELLQVLLSGLLLSLLLPRLSVLRSTIVTAIWVSIICAFNFYAWNQLWWVIPLGYSLVSIALLYLFQQASGYFYETRNIADLSQKFGQYIPPEIVTELSQQQPVQLSGEQRNMCVFFSDVRDFTQMSEQLSPQQLARLMNLYLSEMTAIIHQTRGTVDKYIGDAVMAFWGAPLPDEQHSSNALKAALLMQEQLPSLNQKLIEEGLPPLKVGMGINSGVMNVGNMGSSFRMAYTVMGDAVNLASRLEGLSKYYGCPILVSQDTAEQAPEYVYRTIDRVQVKGRKEPVLILQPIGLASECSAAQKSLCESFEQAVQLYSQQKWDAAEAAFLTYQQAITQFSSSSDRPAEIYLERIEIFKKNPPAALWDGVFTHTEK